MIRRPLRWTFHILALISLLAWLCTFMLLVRSRTKSDSIWISWHGRLLVLFPSTTPGAPHLLMWVTRWDDVHEFRWTSRRRDDKYVSLPWVVAGSGQLASTPPHQFLDLIFPDEQSAPVYVLRTFSKAFTGPGRIYPTRWMLIKNWRTPMILLAVLPMAWVTQVVVRRVNARRAKAGLCSKCGYDLRATPERCPECGTVAEIHMGGA